MTLLAGTAAVLVAAVVAAYYHLSLAWSLIVVALAPVVTIFARIQGREEC